MPPALRSITEVTEGGRIWGRPGRSSRRSGSGVPARSCCGCFGAARGGAVVDGASGSIADEGRVSVVVIRDGCVVAVVDDGDVAAQAARCVAELLDDVGSSAAAVVTRRGSTSSHPHASLAFASVRSPRIWATQAARPPPSTSWRREPPRAIQRCPSPAQPSTAASLPIPAISPRLFRRRTTSTAARFVWSETILSSCR